MGLGLVIATWVGILLVVAIFVWYVISIFNDLVRMKNNIAKSWANIDVLLKQRFDEVPRLVETVKGYAKHEREIFEDVARARAAYASASTPAQKAGADDALSSALRSVFAVAENYPRLRANENFLELQNRITGIENEIADRREFYNDSVNVFNVKVQSFPDFVVASLLGYKPQEMFKAGGSEREVVSVKELNS